jgi:NAD+ diphosphatase
MPTFTPGITATDAPQDGDLLFIYRDNSLCVLECADRDTTYLPTRADLGALGIIAEPGHYLGDLDGRGCYACATAIDSDASPAAHWRSLRQLFGRLDDMSFALAGRALQILQWDETHRFCGRCGSRTELAPEERSRRCPACGLAHYPRLAPAVMALIRRGNELLLARSPHFPPEMFSALAGFVEPGESLEETLVREVREEVGIEIANPRYFGSQPWPFPHSLMIAFVADYAGGEINPQADEIEAAGWFAIDRLPRLPHRISIARRLIDDTVSAMRKAGGAC